MNVGKVSENVLKHSILNQLHTRNDEVLNGAGIGADCAIFAISDTEVLAICAREAAVAIQADVDLAGGPVVSMEHLILKCAGNLAVSGAKPIAAMITLLMPEETEPEKIKNLMKEAEAVCGGLSMQIAGGQTRITEDVKVPYAVVTGLGKAPKQECRTLKNGGPGQDIVLSKWIGLEGTAMLARKNREQLLGKYPAYLAEEAGAFDQYLSVIPEAATAIKSGVCAMHDASEGGIFAALWELAEGAGVGLNIDLKKIPIRQETVEICECCGVNPYMLLSGGCLVMTTQDGQGLVEALEAEGIPATVIGRTTDGNDRIIHNGEEVRYMDKPGRDEIYR